MDLEQRKEWMKLQRQREFLFYVTLAVWIAFAAGAATEIVLSDVSFSWRGPLPAEKVISRGPE